MEGKSDTHPITIGHIYFCCYLVHFTLVWFAFCCLQPVRLMSPLAVVSVVFSRKCLIFQAQQAVIDILNPIKCGPRLDCRLVAVTLSFFPHCLGVKETEMSLRWCCINILGFQAQLPGHHSFTPYHIQKSLSLSLQDRNRTTWPLLAALFLHSSLIYHVLFHIRAQVSSDRDIPWNGASSWP